MKIFLLKLAGIFCILLGAIGLYVSVVFIYGATQEQSYSFTLALTGVVFFAIFLLIFSSGLNLFFVKNPHLLNSLAPKWVKVIGGLAFTLTGIMTLFLGQEPKSPGAHYLGAIMLIVFGLGIMGFETKRDAR